MKLRLLLPLLISLPALAQPKAETVAAFDRYVATAEQRIAAEEASPDAFLRINSSPFAERGKAAAQLRNGEVLIEKVGNTPSDIPGGMIHDWIGTAFIPSTTVADVLATVQDYDHLAPRYRPEVEDSKLLSRRGDDFHIFMRLRKHKVVTVVLDTESDVHYGRLDPQHWFSISRSTRIDEVGGGDHGFLWRLNSYWRFVQAGDGVIVQCEAISLTRDIPTGLGWMVGPFVTKIPRESLEFTLASTRKAVEEGHHTSTAPATEHAALSTSRRNYE